MQLEVLVALEAPFCKWWSTCAEKHFSHNFMLIKNSKHANNFRETWGEMCKMMLKTSSKENDEKIFAVKGLCYIDIFYIRFPNMA